jgi:hypothetical protein
MGRKKREKPLFEEFRSNETPIYTTVKIPLNKILRDRKILQPAIYALVSEMNDLVIHAYQFIRLFIITRYATSGDTPEIDHDFVMYCLRVLGTRDARGRKSTNTELQNVLEQFYTVEYQPLLNHVKTSLVNKSYIIPYLATQIHTAITNNVQERFIQHFNRFINKTAPESEKALRFQFKHRILSLEQTNDSTFDTWKSTHLSNILPSDINISVYYDVKKNPMRYLKGMLYMNKILEAGGHKLFQPLPLRTNIIPKNITIDTSSVISLFCPDAKKGDLLKAVKKNQEDVWNNLLNLQHKVFKNKKYHFHHQIQTDGFSCSILFIRNDFKDKKWGTSVPIMAEQEFHKIEDLSKEQLEALRDRNVVGCDPGKKSMVYMVDDKGNKLQYTAKQRRIESYAKRNQRIQQQMKDRHNITYLEASVSEQNSKSMSVEIFRKYLIAKTRLNREVGEFYRKEVWRKMKFRQYSYAKKSLDNFLNKIQETFGDNILIGYGDWSRSTQMKHFMPTLGKGLRKKIHKRFDTITIHEYNTSKLCCDCSEELKHYKDKNNKEVYRLFCCVSCKNKEVVFRTRDANSAKNMRNLTRTYIEDQSRPIRFCRPCTESCLSPVLEEAGQRETIVGERPTLIDFTRTFDSP